MNEVVDTVVLLIGLAVGVDYSLFYLKREREERAAGKGPRAALEAAAATSGCSVLISGMTVMIAMAGMLLTGNKINLSLGVATMLVVAAAMLGSLTVLPALRRPLLSPIAAAGVLLVLAVPHCLATLWPSYLAYGVAFVTAQRSGQRPSTVCCSRSAATTAGVALRTVRRRLSSVSGLNAFLHVRGDSLDRGQRRTGDPAGFVALTALTCLRLIDSPALACAADRHTRCPWPGDG